jgi:hypothetical protein
MEKKKKEEKKSQRKPMAVPPWMADALFLPCSAGNGTQSLIHVRQTLDH